METDDWLEKMAKKVGATSAYDVHRIEWLESLDFLNELLTKATSHVNYYGPKFAYRFEIAGREFWVPQTGHKPHLTLDFTVEVLQHLGCGWVSAVINDYSPEEWDWLVTEVLPERAAELKEEKDYEGRSYSNVPFRHGGEGI
jgi:transposase InsO family protein